MFSDLLRLLCILLFEINLKHFAKIKSSFVREMGIGREGCHTCCKAVSEDKTQAVPFSKQLVRKTQELKSKRAISNFLGLFFHLGSRILQNPQMKSICTGRKFYRATRKDFLDLYF